MAQDLNTDRALEAFRRLLADAASSEQARVDAILALSQRTVFVPTWPGTDTFRTLVNSRSLAALPVFSSEESLAEAAPRFGWLNPDGTLSLREVGAREAFSYVVSHNLAFVVVDVHAAYSLELDKNVVEPTLAANTRFGDTGPFAGTGRLSSTLMRAVRASIAPPPVHAARNVSPALPSAMPLPSGIGAVRNAPGADSAPSGMGLVEPLTAAPSDDVLDSLSDALRNFPEVEWACLFTSPRDGRAQTMLGLRISAQFRNRLGDIVSHAAGAVERYQFEIEPILLDDPAMTKAARTTALMFYPWRR